MKDSYFCSRMFRRIFVSSCIASIGLAFANIIDAVAVGSRMGETGLAVVGIVSPVYILFNVLGYGFSIGGAVRFTALISDGKEDQAREHFGSLLSAVMIVSAAIAVLGNVFLKPLLTCLGASVASDEIFAMCADYLSIMFWATPVFILNFLMYDFVRCDDNQRLAAFGFVTGCAMDVLLNILFVIQLNYGVVGSICSTVIAQAISVLIMMFHFIKPKHTLRFRFKKPDFKRTYEAFKVGASTSARFLFQFLFLLIANNFLLRSAEIDGNMYVAIFDIVLNVSYFGYCVANAAAEAIQPLATTFYSEHSSDNLRYLLRISRKWYLIPGAVLAVLLFIFAAPVSSVFGLCNSLSVYAIRAFCPCIILYGAVIVRGSFYQCTGRAGLAALLTFVRNFAVLLAVTFAICIIRIDLFWFIMPVSELVAFLIMLLFFRGNLYCEESSKNVFQYTLENNNQDISVLLEKISVFLEENGADMKQSNVVTMVTEELCGAIILNAFDGTDSEFIQITIVDEKNGDFVLHIRDTAESFNPFEMNAEKISGDLKDSTMDAIGVLMIKKKSKEFSYRRYGGFNVLIVKV